MGRRTAPSGSGERDANANAIEEGRGIDRRAANANANVSRDARVEEFRRMMRERYVDGADGDAEYRRVDADVSLDDA